jgi:hypothetical protein
MGNSSRVRSVERVRDLVKLVRKQVPGVTITRRWWSV